MKYFVYRVIGILYCITSIVHIVQAEEGVIKDAEFVIEKERKNQLSTEDKFLEKAPVIAYIPDPISTMSQPSIKSVVPQFPITSCQGGTLYRKVFSDEVIVHRNYITGGCSIFPSSQSIKPYLMLFLNSKAHRTQDYGMQFFYTPMRNIDYAVPCSIKLYSKLCMHYCILQGNVSYQYDHYDYWIDNKKNRKTSQEEALHRMQASIICRNYEEHAVSYRTALHYHFLDYRYKKLNEHIYNLYVNIRCMLQNLVTFKTKSNFYVTRYQSNKNVRHRGIGSISPLLIATFPYFVLKIGGWLFYQNNDLKKTVVNNNFYTNPLHLGPKLKIKCIYNNITLYIGLGRTMEPLFLHKIYNENIFLAEDTELKHHQFWKIDGGIKISLFTYLMAHVGILQKWTCNAYRFLPTQDGRFNMRYCDEATKIATTNFFGVLHYTNSTNFINIYLKGDYYIQSKKNIPAWWYEDPRYKINAQIACKLFKNVLLKPTFYFIKGIKIKNRFAKDEQLEDIIDCGIGCDYLLDSKCTIFLSASNLLNRENKYYVGYPAKSFYLIVGLNYSW